MPNAADIFDQYIEAAQITLAGDGEPEASIRSPLESLLTAMATTVGVELNLHPESLQSDLGAKPDWSAFTGGVLVGHVEAKAPGKGVNVQRYKGHDKQQWEKLQALPNVLYTDGNSFALYRDGQRHGKVVRLGGDLRDGDASLSDTTALHAMLTAFVLWSPVPPASLSELAHRSARLCRLLRDEVTELLDHGDANLRHVASDWKAALFPNADDAEFADQYAQTVTFALLLARSSGVSFEDKTALGIAHALGTDHTLMGRALQVLTDTEVATKLQVSLTSLIRVIGAVDWQDLTHPNIDDSDSGAPPTSDGPWLHFYEDFLQVYDPRLRQETGSYYTPTQVVRATNRLVDEALRMHLNVHDGLADNTVTVIDPACGTGTYLLDVVDRVAQRVIEREGNGAVPARITDLMSRLIGFELQVGPHAVSQLRLHESYQEHGASPTESDVRLYVADTLADPNEEVAHLGHLYDPISTSRKQANRIKADTPVLAVIGNPPYKAKAKGEGGWIEQALPLPARTTSLLDDFRAPADWRLGRHEFHMSNLYTYFWRWALWKVFEAHPTSERGVIGFITSSGWLRSKAFAGMRRHMQHQADRLYVIDLGGESRGGRTEDNVFAIRIPVAITIVVRDGSPSDELATVQYRRIKGTRAEKLAQLNTITGLDGDGWTTLTLGEGDPIGTGATPAWQRHPLLTDLLPWTPPSVKPNRTWVYHPDPEVLKKRWTALVTEADPEKRRKLHKPTRDAQPDVTYAALPGFPRSEKSILQETETKQVDVIQVGYRSLDRQWLIADRRVIATPRPDLWRVRNSTEQVYLGHNHADPAGVGPATVFFSHLPDQGHYNGRNDVTTPLWRDADATVPNVAPGLLQSLSTHLAMPVAAPDLFAYVAAITSHPGYADTFWDELEMPGLRVPVTANANVFAQAVRIGQEVIWLHTYGQRFVDPAQDRPTGPPQLDSRRQPLVVKAIPSTEQAMPQDLSFDAQTKSLLVGEGCISPVSQAVWNYEVSGMRIIDKWFGYRRREPKGRKSSPLDKIHNRTWPSSWTTDLLNLIRVLQRCVDLEPVQRQLLDTVMSGTCIEVEHLEAFGVLPVTGHARKPLDKADTPGQMSLGESLG